jgi:polyadenylate-binding protein
LDAKIMPLFLYVGVMFYGKPLYVALAQRKKDRQAILQQHFTQLASRMVGSANSMIPTGYPHVYFAHPSTHLPPQGHPTHGFVYPPMGISHERRQNMFPSPQNLQQIQSPMVWPCLY